MTTTKQIAITEDATLIWDDPHGDGSEAGWFLRYTDQHGQVLDEIIEATDRRDAEAEARTFLARSS